ncbi:hypothetical protein [Thiomicrorhabdus sp.]|uniref:hypothetical protein n=1 Tax=Thiomicrorhabdus sp. TaxID=2039724 RepID=UPI0029C82080|nr:hypothetical protein [Thiomicrorhabdus sp.]
MTSDKELVIHTLGPSGTNCEMAAQHWMKEHNSIGRVVLHQTLEEAQAATLEDQENAMLLGCVVYPDLHNIVFEHLQEFELMECFVVPTLEMVLAGHKSEISVEDRFICHPAPKSLLPKAAKHVELATSNAEAARRCALHQADFCITTLPSALENGLMVVQRFGEIKMGFSVHKKTIQEEK